MEGKIFNDNILEENTQNSSFREIKSWGLYSPADYKDIHNVAHNWQISRMPIIEYIQKSLPAVKTKKEKKVIHYEWKKKKAKIDYKKKNIWKTSNY